MGSVVENLTNVSKGPRLDHRKERKGEGKGGDDNVFLHYIPISYIWTKLTDKKLDKFLTLESQFSYQEGETYEQRVIIRFRITVLYMK